MVLMREEESEKIRRSLVGSVILGLRLSKDLIFFSFFLASFGYQAIRITRSPSYHPAETIARINRNLLRVGMLASGVGSVAGCLCLMLALVNLVQIKLGTLACGSTHSFAAVVPLLIFVPLGLFVYVSIVLYAFTR